MRESTFFQALPVQLVHVLIAALVLTLIGPYDTYGELRLDARLGYWTLSTLTGWMLMMGISALVDRIEPLQGWPVAGRMAVAGFIGGIPMTVIVWGIEALFRRELPLAALPEMLMHTTVLTIVMSVAIGQAVEFRLQMRSAAQRVAGPGQQDLSRRGSGDPVDRGRAWRLKSARRAGRPPRRSNRRRLYRLIDRLVNSVR